jgi:hypothetical protein
MLTDDEFKKKLSEVAEWVIPETPRETSLNQKKKRGRKSAEEEFQEAHEEIFLEIHEGRNPTYPPMITRVKCQPVDCEDCGKHCENGRRMEIKQYDTNRIHWRKRCVTCEKNENPWTGEFDLTPQKAATEWAGWLRKTNPRYVKKAERENSANTPDSESEK